MKNTLVICRTRYNAFRHNPLELIMLLNFLAIAEEDGTYTIKKDYYNMNYGNVSRAEFEERILLYK